MVENVTASLTGATQEKFDISTFLPDYHNSPKNALERMGLRMRFVCRGKHYLVVERVAADVA